MAKYDTVTKQLTDDITVTISKKKGGTAGDRLVAFLKWLSENITDPGYGRPEGGRPDQGLPGDRPPHVGGKPPGSGGERPDQGLPGGGGGGGGGRPDNTLPGQQPGIDNELPGAIGENADKIAKLILASCFDCKVVDNTPPGGEAGQPKR